MGIKIKKQEDRIKELRQEILQLIEEMRSNNDRKKVNEVLKLQKEYWGMEMDMDIPDMPENKRKEFLEYMSEFVPLGIKKGYFSFENILDVLKQLTLGVPKFELLPDTSMAYGAWGNEHFLIKKNLDSAFLRHVTMHELTHCVTMPYLKGNEIYSTQKIPRNDNNQNKREEERKKKKEIYVRGKTDVVFKAQTIIAELIAEATACDLCDSYQGRTYVGDRRLNITSDWVVPYNRAYQQLGDEFLQTVYFINNEVNTTDRMRFKALTIMALDPNNQIVPMIIREYREKGSNGLEDLHFISEHLEKINNHPYVPQEAFYGFRSAIEKYMPENWRPDEYIDDVVERDSTHITPREIAETSKHAIRINPGQVSKGVRTTREIKIRNRTDQDNSMRNK